MKPSYADLSVDSVYQAPLEPWGPDGVVVMPSILPDSLIDAYRALRERVPRDNGWKINTPYMYYKEIRDLCLYPPLLQTLRQLIGTDPALSLILSGWVSTERDWHSDSYLNPPEVKDRYAAVWMALEDISPASGPFQYVPGSHLWPVLSRDKLFQYLTPAQQADPNWPFFTENEVAGACAEEIQKRGGEIRTYLPKRGDVLVWHSHLIHRGSRPAIAGTPRRSLIAHYTGVHAHVGMPFLETPAGWVASFGTALESDDPAPTGAII